MKKTVKIGGKEIEIRGLKWRQVQELKEKGYNISFLNPMVDNDDLVIKTIEKSCGDTKFIDDMDLDAIEVYKLFKEIHKLTYVPEETEKNS